MSVNPLLLMQSVCYNQLFHGYLWIVICLCHACERTVYCITLHVTALTGVHMFVREYVVLHIAKLSEVLN